MHSKNNGVAVKVGSQYDAGPRVAMRRGALRNASTVHKFWRQRVLAQRPMESSSDSSSEEEELMVLLLALRRKKRKKRHRRV